MPRFVAIALWTGTLVSGQDSTPALSFEVASIKPVSAGARDGHGAMAGLRVINGRANLEFVTLKNVIQNAYGLRSYQIAGPDWLASERFDIVATLPDGATREQVPQMLQTLLSERFHFVTHRETRMLPVYELVIAKNGPKIHQVPSTDNKMSTSNGRQGHRVWGRFILANLINAISRTVEHPIVDKTGLEGYFDIDLRWSDGTAEAGSESAAPSLFTALQETLGLKLESRKSPINVLVVDRAEKVPTEN